MGGAMAKRILAASHAHAFELHLWARRHSSVTPFTEMGATAHATAHALAQSVDVLLINVTGTADVEGLLLGLSKPNNVHAISHDGIASVLKSGTLVIDFSTIDAQSAKNIAQTLAHHGIEFLDCPVSGGVKAAEAGTLSMMAGGSANAFERAQRILQHLGQTIVHVGPSGAGQVVKAANQMIMCANLVGIAEAMTYAQHYGADLPKMLSVLQGGFAASKVLDWVGPRMAGLDETVLIQSRLHEKDLRMVANACEQAGLHLPVTQTVATHLSDLVEQGKGQLDTSQVLNVVKSTAKGH